MKTKFIISALVLFLSIASFAQTTLTQSEKETLAGDPTFRSYLIASILGDDTGGVAYLLNLTSFANVDQAKAFFYSKQIEKSNSIVAGDASMVNTIMLRMTTAGIDKRNAGTSETLVADTIAYLGGSVRIDGLVQYYLVLKASPSW